MTPRCQAPSLNSVLAHNFRDYKVFKHTSKCFCEDLYQEGCAKVAGGNFVVVSELTKQAEQANKAVGEERIKKRQGKARFSRFSVVQDLQINLQIDLQALQDQARGQSGPLGTKQEVTRLAKRVCKVCRTSK